MKQGQAVTTYAKVLLTQAETPEAVTQAQTTFQNCPQLLDALSNPTIPEREKFAVIDRLFPASLRTFLKVVCRNGQIDSIAEIFSEYIRLARQERQCAHAVLEYVTPLTAAQLAAMKQVVCAKTGKTEAELELRKNDELEGGFVLHIGDDTYDRSVRGIARYMRRRLIRR